MLSYLPEPEKMEDASARKFPCKKMHPMTSMAKETGRNLLRHMPRIRRNPSVPNTMDQSLAGQCIIVTGSSSGIGLSLAENCAMRGARVILACRDVSAGDRAAGNIISSSPNADLAVYPLDLASFDSVRFFAQQIMEMEERIDVLINNAATMCATRRLTEDGHEETMQVNYFAPVLLTMSLLDHMCRTSSDPRIIFVSSIGHAFARELFLKDMDWKYFPKYRPLAVYNHSKLALMLFVRELSKRADARNVRVYAADPGMCVTNITRNLLTLQNLYSKFKLLVKPFLRTAGEGAQSILSVIMMEKYGHNPDVYYFADGKERPCSRLAQNDDKAAELWILTQEILQLPAMHLLPITSNV